MAYKFNVVWVLFLAGPYFLLFLSTQLAKRHCAFIPVDQPWQIFVTLSYVEIDMTSMHACGVINVLLVNVTTRLFCWLYQLETSSPWLIQCMLITLIPPRAPWRKRPDFNPVSMRLLHSPLNATAVRRRVKFPGIVGTYIAEWKVIVSPCELWH